MMNLVYACVFFQDGYIDLLEMLIKSISKNTKLDNQTEYLIITSNDFKPKIEERMKSYNIPLLYYILEASTLFQAACARLHIFDYENIDKYDKILYIDTDALVIRDLNILLSVDIESNKIYAPQDGNIGGNCWGGGLFDLSIYDPKTTAFTSCVLFFKNSDYMKDLFGCINNHIINRIYVNNNAIPDCLDQPFIVYNSIKQKMYDNQLLLKYFDNHQVYSPVEINRELVIYHFPGGPGNHSSKFNTMTRFWNKLNE